MPQINVKLIHVSSKTHEFLFAPSASVATITQHVYDNWPEGEFKSDHWCSLFLDTWLLLHAAFLTVLTLT